MKIDIGNLLFQKSRLDEVKNEINSTFNNVNVEIEEVCNNVNVSSLIEANQKIKEALSQISTDLNNEMGKLTDFIGTQLKSYEVTHDEALEQLRRLIVIIDATCTEDGNIVMRDGPIPTPKPISPTITPINQSNITFSINQSNVSFHAVNPTTASFNPVNPTTQSFNPGNPTTPSVPSSN